MGKIVLGGGNTPIRSFQKNSPAVKHATNYPGGASSTVKKPSTSSVGGGAIGTPFGKSGVTRK